MTGFFDLDGPKHPPAGGGAPDALVILLHGYGADGFDLMSLAPHLGQAAPRAQFSSPHAPFPCEMGFGRQWFGVQGLDGDGYLAGVRAAASILDAFIDAELAALGLAEDRLALVGFSQGTMMALHLAPRRAAPVAGVVGFSGRLVGAALLDEEATSKPPFLLIHGDADEVVPHAALAEAVAGLESAGIAVEAHTRPGLGHGIDQQGIALGARFLGAALVGTHEGPGGA